jgi:metal-dependent hydrolase (beta-lactamase superfamily II)
MTRLNIVNVGYDSTNYYVITGGRSMVLVDIGFPGTLPKLRYQCKRMDIPLTDIRWLLCTHYHPDHAGLAQDLRHIGIKLMALESQLSAIPVLRTVMKPRITNLTSKRMAFSSSHRTKAASFSRNWEDQAKSSAHRVTQMTASV